MAKTLIEFIAGKITANANAQPASKAAAAGSYYQSSNAGTGMIGQYYSYIEGEARNKAMIGEKLILHTGVQMLAEHVQRAVAVRSQNSIALSSQRSPGPIELARCLVWAAALASRPTSSGKPMIVVASR